MCNYCGKIPPMGVQGTAYCKCADKFFRWVWIEGTEEGDEKNG